MSGGQAGGRYRLVVALSTESIGLPAFSAKASASPQYSDLCSQSKIFSIWYVLSRSVRSGLASLVTTGTLIPARTNTMTIIEARIAPQTYRGLTTESALSASRHPNGVT